MATAEVEVPRAGRLATLVRGRETELALALGSAFLIYWVARQLPAIPAAAGFAPDAMSNVANLLAPLVLVAMFIERAVEVVNTASRAEGSAHLKASLKHAAERARTDPAAAADVAAIRGTLTAYKAQSQRMAFLISLVLATALTMAGVRAIAPLLDPATTLAAGQLRALSFLDIGLTALLLAGGADGIHKIVSTFTTYMDATKAKVASGTTAAG